MGDSPPPMIALPDLIYPDGLALNKTVAINQYSSASYIRTVKKILTKEELKRIWQTFMGPVIKLGERSLKLSAKIIHVILTGSIITVKKKNEAWFRFGAQPLSFSIREFHMVTSLRCSAEVPQTDTETHRFQWDFLEGSTHTLEDLEMQLRGTNEESSDERFCLAMLLLIESILLQKSAKTNFPLDYVKKAHDIDALMAYP